mgnify:FL=1|tara:strand:- start:3207 stop:3698 length:492 start_codon:yes stop_codon:yes gene_type:complete
MIYLDIIFLVIIIWGAYNGFLNGLVKELSAVLSLIFGIVLAKNLYPILDEKLNALTDSKLISIISAVIIFILTIIIFKIGAKIATKFINFVYLGFINKLLGSIFGGIKSLLILCFLVFIFLKINTNIQIINTDNLEESTIYVQIKKINKVILQNSYNENGSDE